MPSDLKILGGIILFYFAISVLFYYMLQDTFIQSSITGYEENTQIYNISINSTETTSNPSSFIGLFYSFHIPENSSIPYGVLFAIKIINYSVLLFISLLIYRQIRSGAG
ncbi:MAG: hypothetical protein A2Y62_14275 [Candidatus Fischerbacteria bacterium RBG_13_37_8]|uniref:Uncharacterized protein n=1 Tax=Candidatus Fischerbacteria bacterium RBG_13_37_8 TaxID=1817863 RepID=A0A1F5VGW3_9BACT|nr:MAG: hypothetical protein A2Y62_14275 [Candidatus Fischerbacteria bacterium RBG_13_37_8]